MASSRSMPLVLVVAVLVSLAGASARLPYDAEQAKVL